MSNNYLLFSTGIDNLTDEEMVFWKKKINEFDNWYVEDYDDGPSGMDVEDNDGPSGIDFRLDEKRKEIWICSEEGGSVAFVANGVQEFLKVHRPNGYFAFTWACTCSQMRLDEFSGGGVFVTASKQQWSTPETMIEKEIQKIQDAEKA